MFSGMLLFVKFFKIYLNWSNPRGSLLPLSSMFPSYIWVSSVVGGFFIAFVTTPSCVGSTPTDSTSLWDIARFDLLILDGRPGVCGPICSLNSPLKIPVFFKEP